MPLATLQAVSDQSGSITSATVTIDSSDNLDAVTTAIEDELGSAADVTNSQTIAEATTEPLESVADIALFSLIGALIAGAVIILLTMLMIVRERRREIGVMKAIGASNVAVMWQFVVESLTLTVMGLVIGVLIGIAAVSPLTSALVDSSSSSSATTTQSGPGMRGGPGRMSQFSSAASQIVESIQTSVGASTLAYGVVGALLIAILGSAIPALMISKSGSIDIDGTDIAMLRDGKLVSYRNKTIGFVFQNYNLIPNLTAIENVTLPMEYAGVPSSERKARAIELLEQVGIDGGKELRKPGKMSGGEQQRVSIARALANRPKLILADEPTGNLDSETGKLVFDLLHKLARTENTTIIVVTHDLDIAGKTDKTFHLSDGTLTKKAR